MKPAEMPIGSRNLVVIAAKNALIGTPIERKHPPMPRIRSARFVVVVYRTRQFEKMITWYQVVFDCKVQYQNPVLAFLTYDDEHQRVIKASPCRCTTPIRTAIRWSCRPTPSHPATTPTDTHWGGEPWPR